MPPPPVPLSLHDPSHSFGLSVFAWPWGGMTPLRGGSTLGQALASGLTCLTLVPQVLVRREDKLWPAGSWLQQARLIHGKA